MSERSGGREQSKQSRASERVSSASEQANGGASDLVLQSVFLAVIDRVLEAFPRCFSHSLGEKIFCLNIRTRDSHVLIRPNHELLCTQVKCPFHRED